MKVLLPPSETKVSGGGSAMFAPESLALPELLPQRLQVIDALVAVAADPVATAKALKVSAKQAHAASNANAMLRDAPALPAIERYTGVLFDALESATLAPAARAWVDENVFVHSAPFGPVVASDLLPDYRMSANATIAALGPLKRFWAAATTAALETIAGEFVLDLRSEAYVALGPVPAQATSVFARFVTDGPDGPRALNHFNKKAKGELVRDLASTQARPASVHEIIEWGADNGWRMFETDTELVVVVA